MNMLTLQEKVLKLVQGAPLPPEETIPPGASREQIDAFSKTYRLNMPEELAEWLSLTNGAPIGPGGLYGLQTEREHRDIQNLYTLYPEWLRLGWIPVAGDGCGNQYVLDTTVRIAETHPVYFVDHEQGYDQPDYIVASGLWSFLRFLLARETDGDTRSAQWPFKKAYVLAEDSGLEHYVGPVAFPWDLR